MTLILVSKMKLMHTKDVYKSIRMYIMNKIQWLQYLGCGWIKSKSKEFNVDLPDGQLEPHLPSQGLQQEARIKSWVREPGSGSTIWHMDILISNLIARPLACPDKYLLIPVF